MKKTIKILGHDVEVLEMNPIETNDLGRCAHMAGKIWIATKDVPKSMQRSSLLHETLEHINRNCELGIPHDTLSVIGEVLYQVLTDNPKLFDL